ncbi:sensor histidine kinase [Arundinibacter roseus]|uniref:Signal transduction histidine kinase internal region domain-containing protein n=1 Tax=Arundinibacter roseus TaxID=2070510 RepID=A0A4R4KBB2_9BACT|nr:histidine kinase [Arundinibacter roseus]TDB64032.1 hypothetical protein EZE20_13890 [Arundinibacter roseus]
MATQRYFGTAHLWRFCIVICLIVNLPRFLTFFWNPHYFESLGGFSFYALLLQFSTSLLFGITFAFVEIDSHHPLALWYHRQLSAIKITVQAILFLLLTELLFQIEVAIAEPVTEISFYHFSYFVRHLVILGAIRGFWYFISVVHESNQVTIENEQLKRLKVKNQLEALSNQLNPHFLFNALNILNVSITTDPEGAQNIVHNLSDILRYNLKIQNQNLVRLSEELDVAQSYLGLYKARFGEKLLFSFENTDTRKVWYIVPLSLQILIENAIKHNVITSNSVLHIKVWVNEAKSQLIITNSINKKTQAESLGIGLSNLGKRNQLILGKTTSSSEDAQQFTVSVPLIESP